PRAADGRPVVSVLAVVRDKEDNRVLGYLGADLLVERLGRRLKAIEHLTGTSNTRFQIIDAAGRPLFTPTLEPNGPDAPAADPALLRVYRHDQQGVEESGGTLHVFDVVQPTGWIAVMDRPANALLRPVHDLLRRTLVLVGCLVVGTLFAAVLLASFYRRQLLSSLRTEREQIFNEKILANMPVGIALVDPAGERFLHVNSAFIEVVRSVGHLPREADVRTATFADVALATREALARVLHFGVPFQAIEQRTATAAGPARFLTTNLLRLQDNQQRTIGVLCLIDDATAAVNLRQELINANTAKDQFLAQLSHELRNPLSPVITMVAELEALADSAPAAREPLEIIRRNVELEARLIDDLLDVTRISSGKLQLSAQLVDVHRTLALALEICQREIEDKDLRLELELRARDHFALADPARLQQVFWNLLKNAVKFTATGRRITVRSSNFAAPPAATGPTRSMAATHVVFSRPAGVADKPATLNNHAAAHPGAAELAGPAGFLRIEVTDEGIGIEPQHLRRIFNAFDQGQSSITQRFGGLGLGLAISKAMVEAHGGTLSVSSEGAGKGATFTVDLHTSPAPAAGPEPASLAADPAATLATTAAPPAASPAGSNGHRARVSAPGGGQRVLLVDDHHDTCLGMQRLLNRRGYRVTVAHSVAEGLAKAEAEGRFDLLISDLGLPDGSGCDLMTTLRQRGGPPGIALSGYGMESDIDKTREAGFSEHLIKPVAIDRLEEAMRRLLP
ncbi:MAG: response regulator, partial [Gluconacetobacter diazotrophicus]|nr:response regulator [Gluconacetobacter diazotrophicus]